MSGKVRIPLGLLLLLLIRVNAARHNSTSVGALWNLNEMSECLLHYSALVYDDYGCWCGPGGGGKPVDGIDNCCMNHDHCYDAAIAAGRCYDVPEEYVDWYSWLCEKGEPICTVADQRSCAAALCECDKIVVHCWSTFLKPVTKLRCNRTKL